MLLITYTGNLFGDLVGTTSIEQKVIVRCSRMEGFIYVLRVIKETQAVRLVIQVVLSIFSRVNELVEHRSSVVNI